MKVVLPGGTGQVGMLLVRAFRADGHEVVVLSRSGRSEARVVPWDGKAVEDVWAREIDGADAVINLAGRTVNCRYTAANLKDMMDSRVDSTRSVGAAIAKAARPPRVWLQMSTATIYAHRFDAPNDEATGIIGGSEPHAPAYWGTSIDIAKNWERVLDEAPTPRTRKVALRSAVVMSPSKGGAFSILYGMTKRLLGGPIGGGRQFVSWIHEEDFVRAVKTILEREDLTGAINLAAPNPLPQRDFMRELRAAGRIPIGLPATKWMAEIGAFFLRTDTAYLLKSRRVVPGRLLEAGFRFTFPDWTSAARDPCGTVRAMKRNATAVWKGDLKGGKGIITSQSGLLKEAQYGFTTRFEEGIGTNPEELIAAAHAGCFSMAFSGKLGAAGMTPESITTLATVTLEKLEPGWTVTAIHLDVKAKIPGADAAKFETAANDAKTGCPISRLLAPGTKITMTAALN